MELVGKKKQSKSLTVVSLFVGIIAAIAGTLGYQVAPEDSQDLITLITGVIELGSFGIAWYGRVRATKKIG